MSSPAAPVDTAAEPPRLEGTVAPSAAGNANASATNHAVQPGEGARGAVIVEITVPIQQAGWDQAVGERVRWLTQQGVLRAELKLNPPELGPLEVRIAVDQDQARVQFLAQQPVVREALEAAVPKLRELLGQGGIQLVHVSIDQRQAGDHGRAAAEWAGDHQADASSGESQVPEQPKPTATAKLLIAGLVDCYV